MYINIMKDKELEGFTVLKYRMICSYFIGIIFLLFLIFFREKTENKKEILIRIETIYIYKNK